MEITATRFLSSMATVFLTVTLGAQVTVLPGSHSTQVGTGSTHVPFGRPTAMRVQMAYDPALFTGPVTINSLDFRAEEGAVANAKNVNFEVHMSSLGFGITRLQSAFILNRGNDETTVLARASRKLPALTGSSPGAFVSFTLDTPFSYDPQNGALVVEVIVHSQDPSGYPLDLVSVCSSPQTHYGPPGCGPFAGSPLKVDSMTSQVIWGRKFVLQVSEAQSSALTWLMFGSKETGIWNGVTLPFDLTPIGAAGCFLSIDGIVILSQRANGVGTADYNLFIPSIPQLVGGWLRFQAIALDRSANQLGVVTSQPAKVQVCGWEPVARVYSSGLTAVSGLRQIGNAPVLRLR